MNVGVISDTHGLVRDEALEALRGSELILHAGDIGKPGVIEALERLAPVCAIRGNVDRGEWALAYPEQRIESVADHRVLLIHDVNALDIDPAAAGIDVVVSGHSHSPGLREQGSVLFLNPGSAGPRRFRLPVSLARLHLRAEGAEARLITLDIGAATSQ